ncbi:MAG: putative periplasmic er of the SGNH-family of hydrolase [Devosia sp.]|uniref:SGNH/GDSL hydrolase family protein n=1 Tax=Devosia sp. TaxID=1871048 RepID=UPI00262DA208|nr:DUF459 domain-containing protein [Devosia sp.]MDB5538815.1 putative periplasmic er of the SGNH-family of hydrolase [Devosia sp.]
MQKKPNRFVLWIIGLVVAALVLTDMLPMFVQAREAVIAAPPAITQQAEDGRVLVAQFDQAPRRKRRTLMDLLFGDDEPQQEQAPVIEKPVVKKQKKAAAPPPPAKPAIEKAAGATRLAVFGDSMATDVGKALERFYSEDPNIVVLTQGVGSSSFVRPDFYDWPKAIGEQIAANSFDIAVILIGINDRQKMRLNGESYASLSPEWTTEYAARVSGVVKALRAAGKPTIWIGLPPMEAPKFAKAMIQVNEIQRLAAFSGGAEFLDIYERFATEDGAYTARGPDLNGNQVRMRKDDGIHFSAAGADKLAFYLSQSLKNYYRGGGTVGIEVADPLLGTDAQLMMRPPYQGLGQMKLLEVAGAVISLSNAPKRAADLVTADMADAAPVGFDLTQMIEAPVGRVDAFGVGKVENPTGK